MCYLSLCSPTINPKNNINTNMIVRFVNYEPSTQRGLDLRGLFPDNLRPGNYWPEKQTLNGPFLKSLLPLDFLQFIIIFTMACWAGVKSKKHDSRFGQFSNFLSIGKAVRPPNSQYFSLLLPERRKKCKSIDGWNSYSDKRYTGSYWCHLKGSKAVLVWHWLLS